MNARKCAVMWIGFVSVSFSTVAQEFYFTKSDTEVLKQGTSKPLKLSRSTLIIIYPNEVVEVFQGTSTRRSLFLARLLNRGSAAKLEADTSMSRVTNPINKSLIKIEHQGSALREFLKKKQQEDSITLQKSAAISEPQPRHAPPLSREAPIEPIRPAESHPAPPSLVRHAPSIAGKETPYLEPKTRPSDDQVNFKPPTVPVAGCDLPPFIAPELAALHKEVVDLATGAESQSNRQLSLSRIKAEFKKTYDSSAREINAALATHQAEIAQYNARYPERKIEPVPPTFEEFVQRIVEEAKSYDSLTPIDPAAILTLMWNESSGRIRAVNKNETSNDWGSFQLNDASWTDYPRQAAQFAKLLVQIRKNKEEPKQNPPLTKSESSEYKRLLKNRQTILRYASWRIESLDAGFGLNNYDPVKSNDDFRPELWATSAFNPVYSARRAIAKWDKLGGAFSNIGINFADKIQGFTNSKIQLKGSDLEKARVRAYNEGEGYLKLALKRAIVYEHMYRQGDPKFRLDLTRIENLEPFIYIGDVKSVLAMTEKERIKQFGPNYNKLFEAWDHLNLLAANEIPSSSFSTMTQSGLRIPYKGSKYSALTYSYLRTFLGSKDAVRQYIEEVAGP